jgi:hypothetical protein
MLVISSRPLVDMDGSEVGRGAEGVGRIRVGRHYNVPASPGSRRGRHRAERSMEVVVLARASAESVRGGSCPQIEAAVAAAAAAAAGHDWTRREYWEEGGVEEAW